MEMHPEFAFGHCWLGAFLHRLAPVMFQAFSHGETWLYCRGSVGDAFKSMPLKVSIVLTFLKATAVIFTAIYNRIVQEKNFLKA